MFKTRLISGIILVIIALATIIPGGPVLYVTLLAISLIGMQELYRAMKVREKNFNFLELAGLCRCSLLLPFFIKRWRTPADGIDVCTCALNGCVCIHVSNLSCRPDYVGNVWNSLCGSYAFLHL